MSPPTPIFLTKSSVDYIKLQLETGNPDRIKGGLQQLCKLYRTGYRCRGEYLIAVEQTIVGLLYTQGKDEKVRRWSLNAIARLGREQFCLVAVTDTLQRYKDDPQTGASAIAALYHLARRDAPKILAKLDVFDRQTIALAALQHVNHQNLDMSSFPVNIETASPDQLKLALVVVGLDRAPAHLFHPRHDNPAIVEVLGRHDDHIVSQYSVWAITENANLGFGDLGIDIKLIERQPANVRSWVYQLIGMSPDDAVENWEYLVHGMGDVESEARLGAAVGIKDTFIDGLEPLVLDWFPAEPDNEVSLALIDHIVRQASHCPAYENLAIELYESYPRGSETRLRMAANAVGKPIYTQFMKVDYDGGVGDLFKGAQQVTNNITINGSIQGGAVSVGGDAMNEGKTVVHYNPQTIRAIQSELSKALSDVHAAELDDKTRDKLLEEIKAAQADPTPERLNRVVSFMKSAAKIATTGASLITAGEAIAKASGFM